MFATKETEMVHI